MVTPESAVKTKAKKILGQLRAWLDTLSDDRSKKEEDAISND
jgi:hypothetical protein